MTIGIYCIKNTETNLMYIGQSINIEARFRKHKNKLRDNIHENDYLQRSWNKYKNDCFTFYIIEKCQRKNLNLLEKKYIEELNTLFPNGYNLKTGGNIRIEYPEEVRKKIGDKNRGKTVSKEARKKISENNGRWNLGKHLSEETKKKISDANKGRSPWNLGISPSNSTREKMRMAKLGKKRSPESIQKTAISNQGARTGKLGYHGVYKIKEKTKKRFRAEISYQNKKYRLGNYLTPEEAAKAYDKKALELYGENAKLNF